MKIRFVKYFAFLVCAILTGTAAFCVQALLTPQIYFVDGDMAINKTEYRPGEKISGSVNLWNYEEAAIGDLVFKYQLWGKKIDEVPAQLLNQAQDTQTFSLTAGEKATKQIGYILPANLPNGDFTFRVQLATSRGEELSWADQDIRVSGGGKFLILENSWIVKAGENLDPAGGVYYQPGEAADVVFDIANNSSSAVTAYYKIITYASTTNDTPVGTEKKDAITMESGGKNTISTQLPKLTVPETYFTEIKFFDTATDQPISNSIFFRWIISGENAKVLFIQPDKDAYAAGEEASVKVSYAGAADSEVEMGNGTIEIKIVDKDGNVAGSVTKEVELKNNEISITVPIEKNVNDPEIIATIAKNNKKLDSYSYGINSKNRVPETIASPDDLSDDTEESASESGSGAGYWIVFILLVVLGAIAAVIFVKRNKKGAEVAVIIGFATGSILLAPSVFAAVEVATDICKSTVTLTKPEPGKVFVEGDDIEFIGRYQVTSCRNGLFFNKVSYYITEDKDIPVIDCLGNSGNTYIRSALCTCSPCANCYGATSNYYKNLNCQSQVKTAYDKNGNPYNYNTFVYGNNVKDLDTSQGYKIYKLATAYPGDSAYTNSQRWTVEYNNTFKIPDNVGIYGPVRFYVVYSGTHWMGHWHWNVTYQKGTLLGGPSANTLTAVQPDYCKYEPRATFSWNFESEMAEATQSAYQIQVASDAEFSTILYDTNKINPNRSSYDLPNGIIEYGRTYNWRLKVWDNRGVESDWISGEQFSTPSHHAPQINFMINSGARLIPGETITFIQDDPKASAYCYSTGSKQLCQDSSGVSYEWDFGDGTTSSETGNATHKYENEGTYNISLKITDAASVPPAVCEKIKKLYIKQGRPQDWSDGEPF